MEDTPLPHVFNKIARRQNVIFIYFITVRLKTKQEIQKCLKIQGLSAGYILQTGIYFIVLFQIKRENTHILNVNIPCIDRNP